MQIDLKRVEDAIIADVSSNMMGDDELFARVQRAVDARIDKIFADKATFQIESAINSAITDGFDRHYQRVDSFGSKVGDPTTIRAELEKMVSGYWNTTVDKQGKPATGYSAHQTRAEWLMTQIVAADFNESMKQHVVNAAGQFKDGLRASLHGTVNQLLSEVLRVKSVDDATMQRTGTACIDPAAKA